MRRYCIDVSLIVVFIFLEILISLPLVSEFCFNSAQRSERGYQWRRAGELYQKAALFSPMDTKYMTEHANFLLRQSSYRTEKMDLFRRAENIYSRASMLNPYCAEYMLTLGQLRLQLFLADEKSHEKKLSEGLGNVAAAVRRDPHGVNIAYLAGSAAVSVWKFLGEEERQAALDRLKYALTYRFWYAEDCYARLWQASKDFAFLERATPDSIENQKRLYGFIRKNNLWQFRKVQLEKLESYKQRQEIEKEKQEKRGRTEEFKKACLAKGGADGGVVLNSSWQGHSDKGGHIYENGRMYWEGALAAVVRVPPGESSLILRAKGEPAEGVYPYMVLTLDGEEIGEGFIDSPEWKDYIFEVHGDGGIRVLSVSYINDTVSGKKGEDRNLFLGEARFAP